MIKLKYYMYINLLMIVWIFSYQNENCSKKLRTLFRSFLNTVYPEFPIKSITKDKT